MSRTAAALAAFLMFASLPLASADGAPVRNPEAINNWFTYDGSTFCAPRVPPNAQGVPVGSYVDTAPVADGTRYRFHLTWPMPSAGCPVAVDLDFVSSLAAWPTQSSNGDVRSACGMTGTMSVHVRGAYPERDLVIFLDVPAACNPGLVGSVTVTVEMKVMRPSAYVVCPPHTPMDPCVGAEEQNGPYTCPPGRSSGRTSVVAVDSPLVNAGRGCDDGNAYVSTIGPFVVLETRADACTLHLRIPVVPREAACPAALGAVLSLAPWGHLLP